ncbi:Insulinase (Peptidase family M16) family protein [Trifolium repens]|nr:Insulinase (Peptidase family M16) family protein [Trifolium repens]
MNLVCCFHEPTSYFSDPAGFGSLAHFLGLTEHMLLYANEKNLVEDSYSKYITEVVVRFLAFCSLLE